MPNVVYGAWYHLRNHYLPDGTYLDVNGKAAWDKNYMDVTAALAKDRIGEGTGAWRFISLKDKSPGDTVCNGDAVYVQNMYGLGGYLDVYGPARGCAVNANDVQTSYVRHRAGEGSKTSLWTVQTLTGPAGSALSVDESFHLRSLEPAGTYLDACGSSASQARNDVSTSTSPTRAAGTGTWSCSAYDDSEWKAELAKTADVPPNTIRIEKIQCVIPSSGMAGAQVFGTTAAIIGTAIGGGISLVIATGITAASAGVAAPVVFGIGAITTAECAAIATAIGVAAQAAGTSIGATYPDQAYLKLDGQQVWPDAAVGFRNMNKGDVLDVNHAVPRSGGTEHVIEIFEHDVILSDDLLYRYKLPVDAEFVNGMIVAINDAEASSYIIWLTATLGRSSHQVLLDRHAAAIQRGGQS